MKRWIFLGLVLVSWFACVHRQRLFVRDPFGAVTRGGVHEDGAQVFVNYDYDVLLENDRAPMYLNILQHGQPVGVPAMLKCIHFLVCFTEGYPAPQAGAVAAARLESMSNDQVSFKDSDGREAVVVLR